MKRMAWLLACVVVSGGLWGRAVSGAELTGLSPAAQEAMKGLAAEDFAAREKALKDLKLALGKQIKAMVSSDDPEIQTRLTGLMEFNSGLSRWAIEVLELPDEQRKAQLKWGLDEKKMLTIAKVYAQTTSVRVEGVKELAEDESVEATALLTRLLDDSERAVYLAAMEGVWDRKATDGMVNSLWGRAVESTFAQIRGQTVARVGEPLMFRGRNLGVVYDTVYRRQQDGAIAVDVLLNLKAPQVNEKLKGFFEQMEKELAGDQNQGRMWQYMPTSEPMRSVYRLVEAYKPKEAVPSLVKLMQAQVVSRSNGALGAEKYFWSNRTGPLAALVMLTDQNPEDYKLKRRANVQNLWTVPTEGDETAAVKKMVEWMEKNGEKFGVKKEAEAPKAQEPMQKEDGEEGEAKPAVVPGRVKIQINGGGVMEIQGGVGGKVEIRGGAEEKKE